MKNMTSMARNDQGLAFLLQYENIAWYEGGAVRILDRRIYPLRTEFVVCRAHGEVAQAIKDMVTQSYGPYIAAQMGMVLACHEAAGLAPGPFCDYIDKAAFTLSHIRPTTVAAMERVVLACRDRAKAAAQAGQDPQAAVFAGVIAWLNEFYARMRKQAAYFAPLVPKGGTIMTQCFAETMIGMILLELKEQGNAIKVICPETRPYLQGARLTASVSQDMGFDTTVITDNMPGYVLQKKNVDIFTSAADVITMDGHVINKIGTFQIALLADYYHIPYYVTSPPDREHPDLSTVRIEERDPTQVTEFMGTRVVMEGVKGYYPAFDITPPGLVTGVVTAKGILKPDNLASYFED